MSTAQTFGKTLVSLVSRLLLDDKHACVMDHVLRERWVLLSTLAETLHMQAKDAKQVVTHLMQQRLLHEWRPAPKKKAAAAVGAYPVRQNDPAMIVYIDYVHFCQVVQYRLMRMDNLMVRKDRQRRDSAMTMMGGAGEKEIFECPRCGHRTTNQQTGLSSLGMQGRFRCTNGDEEHCAFECALDHRVHIDSVKRVCGELHPTQQGGEATLSRSAARAICLSQLYRPREFNYGMTVEFATDDIAPERLVQARATGKVGAVLAVVGSRASVRWEVTAVAPGGGGFTSIADAAPGVVGAGAGSSAATAGGSSSSSSSSSAGAATAMAENSGEKTIEKWKKEVVVLGVAPKPWFTKGEVEATLTAAAVEGSRDVIDLARLRAALRARASGAATGDRRAGGNASSLQERFLEVRNQLLAICEELSKLSDAEARTIKNDPHMKENYEVFTKRFPQFSAERGDGSELSGAMGNGFEVTTSIDGGASASSATAASGSSANSRPMKRQRFDDAATMSATAPTDAAAAEEEEEEDDDGWEDG